MNGLLKISMASAIICLGILPFTASANTPNSINSINSTIAQNGNNLVNTTVAYHGYYGRGCRSVCANRCGGGFYGGYRCLITPIGSVCSNGGYWRGSGYYGDGYGYSRRCFADCYYNCRSGGGFYY